MMKKVMLIILICAVGATGCKKKRACVDARLESGKTQQEAEMYYNQMVEHTTIETVIAYEQAEDRDSIQKAKMNELCSKCKTCN